MKDEINNLKENLSEALQTIGIKTNEINDLKVIIKQLLAHELLHLYFPSIYSNKSACYNEGFLDYLSVILSSISSNGSLAASICILFCL